MKTRIIFIGLLILVVPLFRSFIEAWIGRLFVPISGLLNNGVILWR